MTTIATVPKMTSVFVYGTLKSGFPLHEHISGNKYSRLIGPAFSENEYVMYMHTWDNPFPFILPATKDKDKEPPAKIQGELFRVPESLLSSLDKVEGETYNRIKIPVFSRFEGDQSVKARWFSSHAWCYIGNRPDWDWLIENDQAELCPVFIRPHPPIISYYSFTKACLNGVKK